MAALLDGLDGLAPHLPPPQRSELLVRALVAVLAAHQVQRRLLQVQLLDVHDVEGAFQVCHRLCVDAFALTL